MFLFVIWIALFNHFEEKSKFKGKGSIDVNRRKFFYYSTILAAVVLIAADLPYIKTESKNLLYNGDFTLGLVGWDLPEPNIFSWKINKDFTYNGLPSLEVQTDIVYSGYLLWSWISSNLIRVEYDSQYKVITHMAGKNVRQSSIVIQPYDVNGKELDYQLIQVPSGTNGSFGFKQFERVITIPYGVQYVKFYLSAGLADTPGNPGKTYFSDLSISKISSFL